MLSAVLVLTSFALSRPLKWFSCMDMYMNTVGFWVSFTVQLSELQQLRSVEHQVFETEEIARLQEELTESQLCLQEKLKVEEQRRTFAPFIVNC